MKEQVIGIRVDQDLKNKLQLLANQSDRSLSDFIRIQLKKLVDKSK